MHCKNQRNHMELLLNFLHYYYLLLDKICFRESVVHPNNCGGVWPGFFCLVFKFCLQATSGSGTKQLMLLFRNHTQGWFIFFGGSAVLGLYRQQLNLCQVSVLAKKLRNSLKQSRDSSSWYSWINLSKDKLLSQVYPIFCY